MPFLRICRFFAKKFMVLMLLAMQFKGVRVQVPKA